MYTIYKIINKNNDKVYIGRTKQLKRRMIEHRSQYKRPDRTNNSPLYIAMRAEGIENFYHEIIEETDDFEKSCELEKYYIQYYREKLGTDNVTSITVKSTYYSYYPYSLTINSSTTGTCNGIATDTSAYKLLFRNAGNSANCSYWLASSFVFADSSNSCFGLRYVRSGGFVDNYDLCYSGGGAGSGSRGVRAVVTVD